MLILFILLSIWLCRLSEKPGWFKVSHIISMLALEDEHPARGKGLRWDKSPHYRSPSLRGFDNVTTR